MTLHKVWKPTASWFFGVSVTILFLAVWGRAVVVDSETLGESLAPLSGTSTVVDMLANWAEDEFIDAGADPTLVDPTIEYLLESTAVGGSLDRLVAELVDAASSSDPRGSSVNMRALLTPVVPELTIGLAQSGIAVTESQVSEIVADLSPLVIRDPGAAAIVGPSSPTASRLGTATLLASVAIIVFGYSVVAVSEDHVTAIRELFTRIALGGLTFALFLRLGSWVLDPAGGRAPIPETLSHIADSKWSAPLQVAAVAGVIAVGMYLTRRWLRRGEVSPEPNGPPTQQPEQPLSLSGLR